MSADGHLREIEEARLRIEESHAALERSMAILRERVEQRLHQTLHALSVVYRPWVLARDHPRATVALAAIVAIGVVTAIAGHRGPIPTRPRRIPSRL